MKRPPAAVGARVVSRTYGMHGVVLVLEATDHVLLSLLDRRLDVFRVGAHPRIEEPTLRFEFVTADSGGDWYAPAPEHRIVYEAAGIEFRYTELPDQLRAYAGTKLVALCDMGRSEARFMLADGTQDELELHAQTLFTVFLLELMKRVGRYGLHAAGISVDGAGLVIAGPSGAGKSTLTVLALNSLGSRTAFMGDDMLFMRTGASGVTVLGWPEPIDVSGRTVRLVPGLERWLREDTSGERKVRVPASDISSASPAFEVVPTVLVIPRVTGRDRSTVTPISRDEALFELAPNVLLTDAASSQAHLNALATLARSCRCYRLDMGTNMDQVNRIILGLI
jgi:hypothetical protein